jgi:hypothetical protein
MKNAKTIEKYQQKYHQNFLFYRFASVGVPRPCGPKGSDGMSSGKVTITVSSELLPTYLDAYPCLP